MCLLARAKIVDASGCNIVAEAQLEDDTRYIYIRSKATLVRRAERL